jgi:hypothetical protein
MVRHFLNTLWIAFHYQMVIRFEWASVFEQLLFETISGDQPITEFPQKIAALAQPANLFQFLRFAFLVEVCGLADPVEVDWAAEMTWPSLLRRYRIGDS